MMRPSKERTDDDLRLMEKFLSKNQFFSNLKKDCDREAIFESLRVLQLQSYKEQEVVFQFGDFGREFYVILNGSVSV